MIKVNINTDLDGRVGLSRLKYVMDFINSHPFAIDAFHLSLERQDFDIVIKYDPICKLQDSTIHIFRSELFFGEVEVDFDKLKPTKFEFKGEEIYGLTSNLDGAQIKSNLIPFDLFETIFFFISRVEELSLQYEAYIGNKEKFEDNLFAVRNGIHQIPIVDDLVRMLSMIITGNRDEKPTIHTISHDIDIINKFSHPFVILKKIGGHFLHRKSFKGLGHLFNGYWEYLRKGKDPYDTFNWMLSDREDIEKKIYFLSGGDHPWDTPYDQTSDYFKTVLDQVKTRGYEIGIHPSYNSWNTLNLIQEEKSKLESNVSKPIVISRQHFLNFDIGKTLELLLKAGIVEDSSLGFTRCIGFRCGTGFPYHLYDFENECKSELVEDPLVFMDTACLHECKYDSSKYMETMTSFLKKNSMGTRINFNFHNSFFDEAALRNIPLKKWYLEFFIKRESILSETSS